MSSRREASVPARAASSNATLRLSVARRRPARSRLPVTPASAPYSVIALAETKLYPASSLAERPLNLPRALVAAEPSKGELKVGVSEPNLPGAMAAVEPSKGELKVAVGPSKGELKVGVGEPTKRGRNANRACRTSSAAMNSFN